MSTSAVYIVLVAYYTLKLRLWSNRMSSLQFLLNVNFWSHTISDMAKGCARARVLMFALYILFATHTNTYIYNMMYIYYTIYTCVCIYRRRRIFACIVSLTLRWCCVHYMLTAYKMYFEFMIVYISERERRACSFHSLRVQMMLYALHTAALT